MITKATLRTGYIVFILLVIFHSTLGHLYAAQLSLWAKHADLLALLLVAGLLVTGMTVGLVYLLHPNYKETSDCPHPRKHWIARNVSRRQSKIV